MENMYLGTMNRLIDDLLDNNGNKIYFGVNTDCLLRFNKNGEYQNALKSEALKYVDGMGIIYGQRFLGEHVAAERLATTDVFPTLLRTMTRTNSTKSIFLFGGKENVADTVVKNMTQEYPVSFVGTHQGYNFSSSEVISEINNSGADILFIGLGCPAQENWVIQHSDELKCKKILTCGGLFDYYANRVSRAPIFMQNHGLEWFYRMMQEPRRLSKRYLVGNLQYAYLLGTKKLRKENLWSVK